MHLPSVATVLSFAAGLPLALASPLTESSLDKRTLCLFKKTAPKYPNNILSSCLNDDQADFIVAQFKSILTNPDRKAAAATAELLIADGYVEESQSINILAGFTPLDGPSFASKQIFIDGVANAPAIPEMDTLETFHGDCNKISWRWIVKGLGRAVYTSKGINTFHVDPCTGQIKLSFIEFNSITWGTDIGWTCTPPAGGPQRI